MKKRPKQMPTILVCAPADAPFTIAGSSFDRSCATCGARVQIAPSGQRALAASRAKDGPAIRTLCLDCALKGEMPRLEPLTARQREELKNVVPNLWGQRN